MLRYGSDAARFLGEKTAGGHMSLEIGEVAPDFELKSHLGGTVKLSDFRGAKNIFIAFYPLDWTPV